MDDGAETLVELYESSRTTPQSVYKAENLTEGEHTPYADTQKERSGSAVVNQVAYVQVTHSPYIAKDFKLEDQGISLSVGQIYAISYSYTPSYATLDDMTYAASDTTVASVSTDGTVTAKKSGTAVITASSQKAGFPAQWQRKCESREVYLPVPLPIITIRTRRNVLRKFRQRKPAACP